MKSREPKQLNFEFIEIEERERRANWLALGLTAIGLEATFAFGLLGSAYLKVAQPEVYANICNWISNIHMGPMPY